MALIDDMIRNAGAQLAESWKNSAMQMPENELHPDGASTAFQVKLLSNRVTALENLCEELRRHVNLPRR